MIKKTMSVPSETESIRKVSSDILDSFSGLNISKEALFDIKLCVEEAVRNAIIHGNRSNSKLKVKVGFWAEGDKVVIEIEDEGEGFDPAKVPDPTKGDGLTRESGRGVHLIMKLMDKVSFNENRNRIRMEKVIR